MILRLFTALILLLVLGDCISTYLVLTQVPGGEEINPLMIPLINKYGPGVAMTFSMLFRSAGALWFYSLAKSVEARKWLILIGFTFVIGLTLFANVNNWTIWLNWLNLQSRF